MSFWGNECINAAILNNIGCKFLEHGAFREAFETFGDALDSYRESFLRTNLEGGGSQQQLRLEAAAARLREVNLCKSSIVRIMELGDDDFVSLAAEPSFGKFILKGFRLSCRGSCVRDTDVDCAVMLYNFGLAHVLILQFGMRERKAFKDASRLMRFSLGLFKKELSNRLRRGLAENNQEFRDMSSVTKVIATNYSYIIAKRGREAEARQCYTEIEEFLEQNPHHKEQLGTTAPAA